MDLPLVANLVVDLADYLVVVLVVYSAVHLEDGTAVKTVALLVHLWGKRLVVYSVAMMAEWWVAYLVSRSVVRMEICLVG